MRQLSTKPAADPMSRALYVLLMLLAATLTSAAAESDTAQSSGVKHISAFDLPESAYLSEETRSVLAQHHALWTAAFQDSCGVIDGTPDHMAEVRACQAAAFYETAIYKRVRNRYPVRIGNERMGGVYTEIFTPTEGIAEKNKMRVLINLHGGGFVEGSRSVSHLESIPIAAVSGIKVISVDYRQAPEAVFPAASDDVVAVYRALLETVAPESIGVYGCSAGGLLTAEVIARLQKQHLPLPAAIGMFCMGASYTGRGDSAFIARAISGESAHEFDKYFAYFKGADVGDPTVYPAFFPEILRGFPPSLLISGTRDHALSSVLFTHSRLSALGVPSELHVVEGMGHAFFYDPDLPESREMYALVSHFFDTRLRR